MIQTPIPIDPAAPALPPDVRERRLAATVDIGRLLLAAADPEAALGSVTARLAEAYGQDRVAVAVVLPEGALASRTGWPDGPTLARALAPGDRAGLELGQTVVRMDPGLPGGLGSLAAVPIRVQDRLWGVVLLGAVRPTVWDGEALALLETVAAALAALLERREAQAEAAALVRRHQLLLETSNDGIHVLDQDGRVLEANPAFCAMLGYSREELAELRVTDWDTRWPGPELLAGIRGAMDRAEVIETRHRRKDGTQVEVEISVRGVVLDGALRLYASARDISGRRRAEAEARRRHKHESLARMAGAVAHHFNNQLQSVILALDLARQAEPAAARALMDGALASAETAGEVSRLLLTYLGQSQAQPRPLDLAQLCRRCLPLLGPGLPGPVTLRPDLPAPGPWVRADGDQLHQVLAHLVGNAGEALAGTGGVVRIGLSVVPEVPAGHRHPVDFQPGPGPYACLEVVDRGPGIAPEHLDHLFDPFFSTRFTGRGMGLAVVLGIVQAHQGVVTVDSAPGLGSAFRVYLPVLPPPEAAPAQGPATVLYVEDEPVLRETVAAALERLGYTLITAEDGLAGLAAFEKNKTTINCVVTDLVMPRLDGWGLVRALRERAPDLPVVVASGARGAAPEAGEAGWVRACLTKPFRVAELAEVLDRLVKRA